MSRKLKDNLLNGLIWLSAAFSVGILIMIVGFIFANGWSKISWDFLTNDYESHTQYVNVTSEWLLPSQHPSCLGNPTSLWSST